VVPARGGRAFNSKIRPCSQSHHFHFRQTARPRNFHGAALHMAKWRVGESVTVRVDDDFLEGTIQEARGGGWYNIQLSDESQAIFKCRGTQLRQSATTATPEVTVQMFTAPNKTRPVIVADFGVEPEYSPPPPTIHDLDAAIAESSLDTVSNKRDRELLKQVAHHASYEKWVVFTDLHCAPASLDTCIEVLTQVHKLAVERNAGVLFLGDFWHHRGTLRVDCLNAVLEQFQTWEVPMIMIPGNHDQVTLGGHNHGLTPFENSYRVGDVAGPLILSYPTKFRDALFVPHIRDVATMESILQSDVAKKASALFVHADVKGAMMNDLIVSIDGIPPASFPPEKLIYSGHFHKPHTVKSANVKIEYLGSPYETTLAEAQDPKTLAILDSSWQCVEYFPIDIGRRHFKVSSWRELLNLHLESPGIHKGYSVDAVKVGDRIVVTVSKEEVQSIQPAVNAHIHNLRESGIMVEVREKNVVVDAFGNADAVDARCIEDLTPDSTWRKYLEQEESRESITADRRKILLDEGFEILNELDSNSELSVESTSGVTDLRLLNVTLEGFGPFQEAASYPLWNRGLVLLKGVNNDGGSDR
jgi:DNA repair exonuclease SbcCD nuclease subunit